MKKVEDYLEDGCIFVQGDYCANDDGDKYGNGNWTYFADDGECTFHGCTVTHFAWRNSTGTAPTYTNLVEVKQRNGTVYVDYVKNIDFTLELSDDDVVQWKPYIECKLDWYLSGAYQYASKLVKHLGGDWVNYKDGDFTTPSSITLWKNPKFYKYNQGE